MTTKNQQITLLQRRVSILEKRLGALAVLLGLATLAGLYLALATPALRAGGEEEVSTVIRTRSLNIVNAEGEVVAHLGARTSGAGGFWLTNAGGVRVLKLNQSGDGSGRIAVMDSDGQEKAVLGVRDGAGELWKADNND